MTNVRQVIKARHLADQAAQHPFGQSALLAFASTAYATAQHFHHVNKTCSCSVFQTFNNDNKQSRITVETSSCLNNK